jgi:hypothetical protein
MKLSILRTCLVGLAAIALASCGGTQSFEVTGVVVGHKYGTLQLTDGSGSEPLNLNPVIKQGVPTGEPYTFKFAKQIEYGQRYFVAIVPLSMPPHQSCTVSGGTENTALGLSTAGTAGQFASVSIGVQCEDLLVTLGGRIKVVDANGATLASATAKDLKDMIITNGSDSSFLVTESMTFTTSGEGAPYLPFTLPGPLVFGQTFGVSVAKNPVGFNCAVTANGTGMISQTIDPATGKAANLTNVAVTCTKTS